MKTLTLEQYDELATMVSLLATIQALIIPIEDFSRVQRDEVAWFLDHFLNRCYAESDLDKQSSLQSCLLASIDLLNPHTDLNTGAGARDNFAALLAYIVNGLENAMRGTV